jgi:hypothetical protein
MKKLDTGFYALAAVAAVAVYGIFKKKPVTAAAGAAPSATPGPVIRQGSKSIQDGWVIDWGSIEWADAGLGHSDLQQYIGGREGGGIAEFISLGAKIVGYTLVFPDGSALPISRAPSGLGVMASVKTTARSIAAATSEFPAKYYEKARAVPLVTVDMY